MPSSGLHLFIFIIGSVPRKEKWNPFSQERVEAFFMSNNNVQSKPPFRKTRKTTTATTRIYDPNFGLEAYWPGGDWNLLGKTLRPTTTYKPLSGTPTVYPPQVCDEDCPIIYRKINEICAVKVDETDITLQKYETMKSFCEFLVKSNPECTHSAWKYTKYAFVHVGKCQHNFVDKYPAGTGDGDTKYFYGYTADTFEMGPKNRLQRFMKKFSDVKEWQKYYTGTPYNVTLFQNY